MHIFKSFLIALLLVVGLFTPLNAQDLQVNAAAAIAYNPKTQEVLWQHNADSLRPIASLTKVMTAWVLFDMNIDLTKTVTVTRADTRKASTTHLRARDRLTVNDLLHLMLISSDNVAARVLARTASDAFVARMNETAQRLGLFQTRFADPAGLLVGNVSNAMEMSRLLSIVAENPALTRIMQTKSYGVRVGKRFVSANTTNRLLRDPDLEVLAGKTGTTRKAGFCLATMLHMSYGDVVFVVLGSKSNTTRFQQIRDMALWLNDGY